MRYVEFELFAVENENDINDVGAPIWNLVRGNDDNRVKVQSAFFRFSPMKESFKASLHTSGKGSLCNFIVQSVVEVMRE